MQQPSCDHEGQANVTTGEQALKSLELWPIPATSHLQTSDYVKQTKPP